ncbi:MAG: GH3 auxin-responsive promoter family protein [Dehalococcoidales bacterium]
MTDSGNFWGCGSQKEAWDKYCSFLDLSVDEFMEIQNKLLMEHINLLAKCELGRALMGGKVPESADEFRSIVPLTDYSFYEPFLANKREDALPVKPYDWVCTSSTGGIRKWVPMPPGTYNTIIDYVMAMMIIATSTGRGKFSLRPGDKFFAAAPPPPYFSGFSVKLIAEKCQLQLIPPMDEEYELSDLPARAARGFSMALETGIDLFFGLPSVMVKVGEQLGQRKAPKGMPPLRTLFRMVKGMIKSRLAGRPLVPKDLWKLKLCFVAGMDLEAFRERIKRYWGCDPYEFYAQTEFLGAPAIQTWTRKAMTPIPGIGFFEFIPEKESIKSLDDPSYQPGTCLMNELEAGKSYEVVFTNFYGGAFARYRPKDMITVVALEDAEVGVKLPQWVFKGRADRLIDLGGFTRIDERTIWLALENAQVKYEEWMASKEADQEHPVLHVYISTDTEENAEQIRARLHASLKKYDSSYADLEGMLKWDPLRLTLLPLGVFARWQQERVAAGADPAFVKEQRMQPPAEAIQRILEFSKG